jgi:hypothetical protein
MQRSVTPVSLIHAASRVKDDLEKLKQTYDNIRKADALLGEDGQAVAKLYTRYYPVLVGLPSVIDRSSTMAFYAATGLFLTRMMTWYESTIVVGLNSFMFLQSRDVASNAQLTAPDTASKYSGDAAYMLHVGRVNNAVTAVRKIFPNMEMLLPICDVQRMREITEILREKTKYVSDGFLLGDSLTEILLSVNMNLVDLVEPDPTHTVADDAGKFWSGSMYFSDD